MTERDFEIVEGWLREAMEYGEERHNEPYEKAIKALEELQMHKKGGLCLIPSDVYRKQCEELDRLKEIGTIEEFKALKGFKKTITEIVDRQLIAGSNNYKETYDCFQEIAKVVQDNY